MSIVAELREANATLRAENEALRVRIAGLIAVRKTREEQEPPEELAAAQAENAQLEHENGQLVSELATLEATP